jgi:hypothetical protein
MGIEDILKGSNPNEIKKLIALLQSMVDTVGEPGDHSTEQDADEDESSSAMKTRSRKLSGNSKGKKTFKNKFLTMPEKNMHKEDIEFDKKVAKHSPVPRNRTFKPIKVTCRVCGKSENINPSLVESIQRYKCNQCSTQAG